MRTSDRRVAGRASSGSSCKNSDAGWASAQAGSSSRASMWMLLCAGAACTRGGSFCGPPAGDVFCPPTIHITAAATPYNCIRILQIGDHLRFEHTFNAPPLDRGESDRFSFRVAELSSESTLHINPYQKPTRKLRMELRCRLQVESITRRDSDVTPVRQCFHPRSARPLT